VDKLQQEEMVVMVVVELWVVQVVQLPLVVEEE
jgi:hypothetical protein